MTDKINLSDLYDLLSRQQSDKTSRSLLQRRYTDSRQQNLRSGTIDERMRQADLQSKNLANLDKSQDINLKKISVIFLFALLIIETAAAFTLVFLQGFAIITIEPSTLDILLTATLIQTAYMVTIIVSYLFPKN